MKGNRVVFDIQNIDNKNNKYHKKFLKNYWIIKSRQIQGRIEQRYKKTELY